MGRKKFTRGSDADFRQPPGKLMPVIDANRCEGAGPCVMVCPVDVFTLRKPTAEEHEALSWKACVKVFVHGGKQAFVTDADACRGCGLCVSACPEHAITLARNPSGGTALTG
jgi:4Fe-4S ferredoxin